MGNLSEQEFLEVIKLTPLVSIDLIVQNREGKILFGWRKNQPAKNSWFVPGRRIRKNETLREAFNEACWAELKIKYDFDDAVLLGIFHHWYPTNFLEKDDISTHYVVLAYQVTLLEIPKSLPKDQHIKYEWIGESDEKYISETHPNAREYFHHVINLRNKISREKYFDLQNYKNESQYNIVAARRESLNTLLWHTPVLSLTAQAFLFIIALGPETSQIARIVSAALAFIAAIASIQLFTRHRSFEKISAQWLSKFEVSERNKTYDPINLRINHSEGKGFLSRIFSWSSFHVWYVTLAMFAVAALWIITVVSLNHFDVICTDFISKIYS